MPGGRIAHTEFAAKAIRRCAAKLFDDGTASTPDEAIRIACATMDGAGDRKGMTVESIQTCMNLEGRPVPGLSTDDGLAERLDGYAGTVADRRERANNGTDAASLWMLLAEAGVFLEDDGFRQFFQKLCAGPKKRNIEVMQLAYYLSELAKTTRRLEGTDRSEMFFPEIVENQLEKTRGLRSEGLAKMMTLLADILPTN